MTTKLTLSIDPKIVEKARRISRKRGKSISKMVEEYLNSINEKTNEKKSAVDNIEEIMKPYLKKIKVPDNLDYKTLVHHWKEEDYKKKKTGK